MADLSGRLINRYQVIERLGEGGMATVYRAFDTRLDCDVAIKVIRRENIPPYALDRLRKRFEREAKVLARLNHPNIVAVSDYGEYDGSPYLVMRYMPGGTLRKMMDHVFSPGEAAGLLLPIARALGYAHQQHILHRDIKPANILLTETGEPVLSDFGIARLLEGDEGQTLTGTGVGIGTPDYMAPEQSTGGEVDGRADLYALGVLFYEMVTGRKPFEGENPIAVMIKHASEPIPSPRRFVPTISGEVEKVLSKALAKKPEDRYADMSEFAAVLEHITRTGSREKKLPPRTERTPTPASKTPTPVPPAAKTPPTTPPYLASQLEVTTDTPSPMALLEAQLRAAPAQRTKQPVPRWFIYGAPAVVVITLIASIIFAFPDLFTRPGENTTQPTALSAVGTGMASPTPRSIAATGMASPTNAYTQASSPSQAAQATLTPSPQPSQSESTPTATLTPGLAIDPSNAESLAKIAVQDYMNLIDAQPIPGTREIAVITDSVVRSTIKRVSINDLIQTGTINSIFITRAMAFSQVSNMIAIADAESGKFHLVSLANNQNLRSINGYTGQVGLLNGIAFSPDGKWIVETLRTDSAKMYEAATGKEISTFALKGGYRFDSAAFSPDGKKLVLGYTNGIAVFDPLSGKLVRLVNFGAGTAAVAFSPDGSLLAVTTQDRAVALYQTASWTNLRYFSTPDSDVYTVAFSPDGKILAAGGKDGQAYLWDVSTGKKLAALNPNPGANEKLIRVFFSERGDRFVTVTRTRLTIWSVPAAGEKK